MKITPKSDYAIRVWPTAFETQTPLSVKLSVGEVAEGFVVQNNRLECYVKGTKGWVNLSECKEIEPPPPPIEDEPTIPPIPPLVISPRGDGAFLVVKNSMQVYNGLSRPAVINPNGINEVGYPDIWAIKPESSKLPDGTAKPHFTRMTEDICHWLFRINVEVYQGFRFSSDAQYMTWWRNQPKTHPLIRDWASLMRGNGSHTNRFGSDTCYDPISQTDRKGKEYMRFFQVITGGWVSKINSTRSLQYKVECIRGSGGYRDFHPYTHPHLFDVPLITYRQRVLDVNGKWDGKSWRHITRHYGQFNGKPILPALLPFDDKCMIEKSICILLDPYQETPDKFRFV